MFGTKDAICLGNVGLESGTEHSLRVRDVLVMLEVALATMAVVGAWLFERTFRRVSVFDLGLDPNRVQKRSCIRLRPDRPPTR